VARWTLERRAAHAANRAAYWAIPGNKARHAALLTGRTYARTGRLAWCPAPLLAAYTTLRRAVGAKAAAKELKAIIKGSVK
jgi:hypothetical protein